MVIVFKSKNYVRDRTFDLKIVDKRFKFVFENRRFQSKIIESKVKSLVANANFETLPTTAKLTAYFCCVF